ncbi:hypothetical protein OGAPHI_002704 [Ogataea philodendri]|uniref:Uncharacterized protein n=1 Tax=Ogataea philodendri TaxID=1378263 RepID=A0A9P8PCH3_9ASCO|nr:uncharacterized protein OGAPHI_002704 [Ogataea philodendri]KAH3668949.1 hypothetical protein OGAPHI_002704 [Ogataea philodendri]
MSSPLLTHSTTHSLGSTSSLASPSANLPSSQLAHFKGNGCDRFTMVKLCVLSISMAVNENDEGWYSSMVSMSVSSAGSSSLFSEMASNPIYICDFLISGFSSCSFAESLLITLSMLACISFSPSESFPAKSPRLLVWSWASADDDSIPLSLMVTWISPSTCDRITPSKLFFTNRVSFFCVDKRLNPLFNESSACFVSGSLSSFCFSSSVSSLSPSSTPADSAVPHSDENCDDTLELPSLDHHEENEVIGSFTRDSCGFGSSCCVCSVTGSGSGSWTGFVSTFLAAGSLLCLAGACFLFTVFVFPSFSLASNSSKKSRMSSSGLPASLTGWPLFSGSELRNSKTSSSVCWLDMP